jgi:hypothetical protein
VLIVVTEFGLVVVADYLERGRANSQAHGDIWTAFELSRYLDKTFSANKNEKNLRLEWALKGTGVVEAENNQEVGIQRTQSWLLTGQFKIAYTAKRTYEQMKAYRRKDNTKVSTGEKAAKEDVFKLHDELPDAVRYALMTFPELPNIDKPVMSLEQQTRLAAMDDRSRRELEIMAELSKKRRQGADVLTEADRGYPMGDFFQHEGGPEEVTDYAFLWGQ